MKRVFPLLAVLVLLLGSAVAETDPSISMTGTVTEIERHGHAVLDITIEDFNRAGFDLGDVITVKAGTYEDEDPYLDGYYVDREEGMVRARAGDDCIALCINYGKFAETAGVDVGDPVTLTLKEKAGALDLQEIYRLAYSENRDDFASDEVFANFRPILEGKLYRSASPVNNRHNRAGTADRLSQKAGIQTVMNMADTEEETKQYLTAEDFASPHYRKLYEEGNVVLLGMPINYTSDEFAVGMIAGLTFLAERETPYLIHCTEGKDRTGFAAMILEMLAGFTTDDIIEDYMITYVNYYGVEPGTEKYDLIIDKNIKDMMLMVAGLEKGTSLEGIDWKPAAERYLTSHGMSEILVKTLEAKLKGNAD